MAENKHRAVRQPGQGRAADARDPIPQRQLAHLNQENGSLGRRFFREVVHVDALPARRVFFRLTARRRGSTRLRFARRRFGGLPASRFRIGRPVALLRALARARGRRFGRRQRDRARARPPVRPATPRAARSTPAGRLRSLSAPRAERERLGGGASTAGGVAAAARRDRARGFGRRGRAGRVRRSVGRDLERCDDRGIGDARGSAPASPCPRGRAGDAGRRRSLGRMPRVGARQRRRRRCRTGAAAITAACSPPRRRPRPPPPAAALRRRHLRRTCCTSPSAMMIASACFSPRRSASSSLSSASSSSVTDVMPIGAREADDARLLRRVRAAAASARRRDGSRPAARAVCGAALRRPSPSRPRRNRPSSSTSRMRIRAKLPALFAAFSTSTMRPSTTAAAEVAFGKTPRQQFDFVLVADAHGARSYAP